MWVKIGPFLCVNCITELVAYKVLHFQGQRNSATGFQSGPRISLSCTSSTLLAFVNPQSKSQISFDSNWQRIGEDLLIVMFGVFECSYSHNFSFDNKSAIHHCSSSDYKFKMFVYDSLIHIARGMQVLYSESIKHHDLTFKQCSMSLHQNVYFHLTNL